jgi:hypothetical protein
VRLCEYLNNSTIRWPYTRIDGLTRQQSRRKRSKKNWKEEQVLTNTMVRSTLPILSSSLQYLKESD